MKVIILSDDDLEIIIASLEGLEKLAKESNHPYYLNLKMTRERLKEQIYSKKINE